MMNKWTWMSMLVAVIMLAGCQGRPTIFPNPDPSLRKTSTQFAADAARRFPYRADAPREQYALARVLVAYGVNRIEVVNFSGEDWSDVEVWVNRKYVCHVDQLPDRKLKEIHFPMLFDENGAYFPLDNNKVRIESVELYKGGKMLQVKFQANDA